MTNLGTIILVLVCVGIGYVVEPWFFELRNPDRNKSGVTEEKTEKKQKKDKKDKKPAKPKPVMPKVDIDLKLVKAEDFPKEVALYESFEILLNGRPLTLQQGDKITPIRLQGTNLVFKIDGIELEHNIDVDLTDFKQQVLPVMNARLQREEEMRRIEAAKPVVLDAAGIVEALKKSIKDGAVTQLKAEQVSQWEAAEDMEFDGQTYQSGLVTYQEETILGTQDYKAIGLITNGAVVKWISAKTKLEIR